MPAFLQLGDIQGASTDTNHNNWIRVESMTAPITRTIPQGAKDAQRAKGETTLGDVVVTRQLDKSSTKICEACATGKFFPQAEIHFCSTTNGAQQTYLKYVLKNVIVTNYSFTGTANASPIPTETIDLAYTAIEWTYIILDPNDGTVKGNVPGKYNPATGQ